MSSSHRRETVKIKTVVALVLGTRDVASSRIRAHIPLDHIEHSGYRVIRIISSSRFWPIYLFLSTLIRRPEVLFFQKVMPPPWFLQISRSLCARMVFDLDDAIYLGYPGSSNRQVTKASSRVRRGLRYFDLVLTSNAMIRNDLGLSSDSRCVIFPGPSPLLPETEEDLASKERAVLWLGSPSTISNVESILPAVAALLPDLEFLIVGSPIDVDLTGSIRRQQWTASVEEHALRRCWSGLMPLEATVWNKRKAGYKVLEYLRHGVIPVVEDSQIIRTLLGERTEQLCELVRGGSASAWAEAIERSLTRSPDGAWLEAREEVFATWDSGTFARLILDKNCREGLRE